MKATARRLLVLAIALSATARGGVFDETLAKARDGDAIAQYEAAEAYAKGLGVGKDLKQAMDWYRQAAEQGSVEAQMALGGLLVGGKGVPRNSAEAAKWFVMAAEKGNAAAQVQVARMHLAGAGLAKDQVEAYKWARLAADKGDKTARKIVTFILPKLSAEERSLGESLVKEIRDQKASDDAAKGTPPVAPPLE